VKSNETMCVNWIKSDGILYYTGTSVDVVTWQQDILTSLTLEKLPK